MMLGFGGALLIVGWAVSQMDKKSSMFSNSRPLKMPASTPKEKQSAKSHEDAVKAVQSVLQVRGYHISSSQTNDIVATKKIRATAWNDDGFEYTMVTIQTSLSANGSGTYVYWIFDSSAESFNDDLVEETELTSKALVGGL